MVNIDNVIPKKDIVIVKLLNLEVAFDSLLIQHRSDEESVAARYGEVISKGPLADEIDHCPDLKVGEKVIFTEFAGYHIPTEKEMYKAIRGYDIIGKFMKEISVENDSNVVPTGDRVLVEVIDLTKVDAVLVIGRSDPRLADLTYGKILKVNDAINKQELKENQLVAFPPYAGTTIRHYESEDKKELKLIVEHDILFTL